MKSSLSSLAAALVLLFSSAAWAAEPAAPAPAATPEEVIRQTLEAMRAHDFKALAKRAHPAALAELRQTLRPLVAADTRHEISKLFFGVESVEDFDALGDQGVFAALMTQLSGLGGDSSSDARFTVLGSVAEPPDLVHVVYRAAFTGDSGKAASTLNLMTVQKDGGEWKAVLTDNINEMTQKILGVLQSAVPKD